MPILVKSDYEKYVPKRVIDQKIKYDNGFDFRVKQGSALYLPKRTRDGDKIFSDIVKNALSFISKNHNAIGDAVKSVAAGANAAVDIGKQLSNKPDPSDRPEGPLRTASDRPEGPLRTASDLKAELALKQQGISEATAQRLLAAGKPKGDGFYIVDK